MQKPCNNILSLIEDNDELRIQVARRLNVLHSRINVLQEWIIRIEKIRSFPQRSKKKCYERRKQWYVNDFGSEDEKGESFWGKKEYTSSKVLLRKIAEFLPVDMQQWDIYRVCILANKMRDLQQNKSAIIFPNSVRYALQWKPLEGILANREVLRRVMLNILIPSEISGQYFKDRFPFPFSVWKKRYHQRSLDAVARRLKVTSLELKETIQTELLRSHRELMQLSFERVSEKVCGDHSLSTVIFLIADGIVVRP